MTSKLSRGLLSSILSSNRVAATVLRPYPRLPRTLQPVNAARRFKHSIPKPPQPPSQSSTPSNSTNGSSSSPSSTSAPTQEKTRKQLEPHYELTFTCVPCGGRSSHTVSKQGYHHGSVLITCPSCRNRHIISDHLGIFGDRKITVEDLMRERGRLVKRGTLGEDGDVEFWEDETASSQGDATANDPQWKLGELEGEEEAKRLREAKDPSAQSTTNTTTPTSPLGAGNARPSIDGTSHTGAIPSTRREYSTEPPFRSFRRLLDNRKNRQSDDITALREALREDPPSVVLRRPFQAPKEVLPQDLRTYTLPGNLSKFKSPLIPEREPTSTKPEPESKTGKTGFRITKVEHRPLRHQVLQELEEKTTKYHGWTTEDSNDTLRPNERFARNIADGQRSPLSRVPRENAIEHAKKYTNTDEVTSPEINVFSKVTVRKMEEEAARFAFLDKYKLSPEAQTTLPVSKLDLASRSEPGPQVPPIRKLSQSPQVRNVLLSSPIPADEIQQGEMRPTPSERVADQPAPTRTYTFTSPSPQENTDTLTEATPTPPSPQANHRSTWETSALAALELPARKARSAKQRKVASAAAAETAKGRLPPPPPPPSPPPSPSMLIRRVAKRPPPRQSVPPWQRRSVFGPNVVDNNPNAPHLAKNQNKKSGVDVWGNAALSADLRRMIDLGTPAETETDTTS